MKTMKNVVYLMLCGLLLAGCDKYDFLNLDRDNPLDGKNDANMKDGVALKFGSYSVYADNNNDKVVNKGETVKLKVSLKNSGTSAAKSVKATFSTTSEYVSGFSPTTQITYGDISANTVKWVDYRGYNNEYESYGDYTVQFTVSNSTPTDAQIPISISIVDESNNTWSDSFDVTVQ